jgi:hypothetical protein
MILISRIQTSSLLLVEQMIQHFRLLPFLAGIVIGVLFLYTWKDEPLILMKYPHPSNVDGRVYRDKNGVCYKYSSSEVNCDTNEKTLKQYPLQ